MLAQPRRRSAAPVLTPTCRLETRERWAIIALGAARGVPASFLAPRVTRYPLVARRYDGRGLAAFQLIEHHPTPTRDLVYLGPLVSRSGAYLPLFRDIVEALLGDGRAFACAAEIETAKVLESLTALLPTRSFPGRRCALPRAAVRDTLAAFARAVPHLRGFDPDTLTSRVADAMLPAVEAPAAYRLALFGWDGGERDAHDLRAELARGYARLTHTPRSCAS